jgi:hypothetical protein
MSKKYRRPLPSTSNLSQESEQTLKGVSSTITRTRAKSPAINATAPKTAGYDAQKYIARDIKYSLLVTVFVVIVMVILYFLIR